jgi:hypothetical protein
MNDAWHVLDFALPDGLSGEYGLNHAFIREQAAAHSHLPRERTITGLARLSITCAAVCI